jgi:hypothetical protein
VLDVRDLDECCNKGPLDTRISGRRDRRGQWGGETPAGSIKSSQNCTLALTADFHVPKSETRSHSTKKVGFAAIARRD